MSKKNECYVFNIWRKSSSWYENELAGVIYCVDVHAELQQLSRFIHFVQLGNQFSKKFGTQQRPINLDKPSLWPLTA